VPLQFKQQTGVVLGQLHELPACGIAPAFVPACATGLSLCAAPTTNANTINAIVSNLFIADLL
jgi:hypothetical protein